MEESSKILPRSFERRQSTLNSLFVDTLRHVWRAEVAG